MVFEVRRGGAEDDESVEVMVVKVWVKDEVMVVSVRMTPSIWQAHRHHVVESAPFC